MGDLPVDVRRHVQASVAARAPVDEREERSVAAFLEAFDGLADPFDQRLDPVHVTGSGIVVGHRGVVLLKHKRLGIWLQPGGHIDPGETPWDAALRESAEETGLDVSFDSFDESEAASSADPDAASDIESRGVPELIHVDVHPGGRGHTHLDLRYLIDGGDADPAPPEGESQDIAWFGWTQAIAIADPGLRGALIALAERLT